LLFWGLLDIAVDCRCATGPQHHEITRQELNWYFPLPWVFMQPPLYGTSS
jgi:hypothetical protein